METINQETIDKIVNWDWAVYDDYSGLLLIDPNERGKYWGDSILEEAGPMRKYLSGGISGYLGTEYPDKVEYLKMGTLKEIVRDYKRLKDKELNEKEG